MEPRRGTTQWENYRERKRKKNRKQCKFETKNANNAQNKKDTMNASASNFYLLKTSVVQQSSRAAHAQPTSQVHAAVSPLSTTPAVASTSAATTATSRPNAMIPRAGRWTRFWLSVGCVSAQYTDD
jgi:hypothetical protein